MVVISLTDREQTLLSDSVLTMIENAGQAQRLVCDTESQKAIDIHIKELQASGKERIENYEKEKCIYQLYGIIGRKQKTP